MGSTELTQGAVLAALLGTEGFLLAAIGLALRLDEPNQEGVRKRKWMGSPLRIAKATAWTMVALAVGALSAWFTIFVGGSWRGFGRAVPAAALLVAIAAQPVLGLLLAYGAERE